MFNEVKTHELTIDIVVFTITNNKLKVLLVQRDKEPFSGKFAIPGGFIRLSEDLDSAALRVLKEKTNVENIYLEQLYTFGDPLRYPNARVITCAYFALVGAEDVAHAINDTSADWYEVYNLPPMAFDHKKIITYAHKRVIERLEFSPIAYQLLPEKFTLTELQKSYELILNKKLDKRNFRKKILLNKFLLDTGMDTKVGSKRPARLYTFDKEVIGSKRGHFFS